MGGVIEDHWDTRQEYIKLGNELAYQARKREQREKEEEERRRKAEERMLEMARRQSQEVKTSEVAHEKPEVSSVPTPVNFLENKRASFHPENNGNSIHPTVSNRMSGNSLNSFFQNHRNP